MNIEIFGEHLENALSELGLVAQKTYQSGAQEGYITPEVWELDERDFSCICGIKEENWKDDWGWWRNGGCIYEGAIEAEYVVNGQKMFGYRDKRIDDAIEDVDGADTDNVEYVDYCVEEYKSQRFKSFVEWLSETQRVSAEYNIAYFAFSLARDNKMTLAQFMTKYQP